jgi:hypothetical protein
MKQKERVYLSRIKTLDTSANATTLSWYACCIFTHFLLLCTDLYLFKLKSIKSGFFNFFLCNVQFHSYADWI